MNKYLTVKDVMERLKAFPEDMEIFIEGYHYDSENEMEPDYIITDIEFEELKKHYLVNPDEPISKRKYITKKQLYVVFKTEMH